MDIYLSKVAHSATTFLSCSGQTGGFFQCVEDVTSNSAASGVVFIADTGTSLVSLNGCFDLKVVSVFLKLVLDTLSKRLCV